MAKYSIMSENEDENKSFNQKFEEEQIQHKLLMRKAMQDKLNILNKANDKIPLHQLSIGVILINTKDSLFELLDDLLQFKYNREVFTKNDKLFYIGIFLIIIVIFIFLYNAFFDEDVRSCTCEKEKVK